jgi:hypothetical protein
LEQQPFADADDSYFEEEEYGPVSALLGERAKPFLSIPSGPLQVGHFIGALGIVLMAFVEYPGFPLTNLPTPLRDCLQGGTADHLSLPCQFDPKFFGDSPAACLDIVVCRPGNHLCH